ncbi:MAG: SpoIIE family protein phosphatase [Candidatus Aminicenantes bacterium]|nr:SpoIIE family protein phosphatase [Candidatus Aminicenantes bacterium]
MLDRRKMLQAAISKSETTDSFVNLLHQVDAALEKMAKGAYGLCETCHEPIENERLVADPLIRNCIEDLTPEERRTLEHDLDLAHQIQSALLPKQNLKAGEWTTAYHYEAAGPVSGDYCDLIIPQDKDESLIFLLGDVTGKGVAASILMAHLHAIFRSLVRLDLRLDQLMARANRLFCEGTMMTHFATLVCGRAHTSGEVEICNAGHCFPFLVNEGTVTRIPSTGLPLGVFNSEQFSTAKLKLAPKDSLFLFSDGLSEARNKSNVQYGEERISTLIGNRNGISPQAIIGACLEDLKDFLFGAPKIDDLTMMVVQRAG